MRLNLFWHTPSVACGSCNGIDGIYWSCFSQMLDLSVPYNLIVSFHRELSCFACEETIRMECLRPKCPESRRWNHPLLQTAVEVELPLPFVLLRTL